MIQTPRHIQVG